MGGVEPSSPKRGWCGGVPYLPGTFLRYQVPGRGTYGTRVPYLGCAPGAPAADAPVREICDAANQTIVHRRLPRLRFQTTKTDVRGGMGGDIRRRQVEVVAPAGNASFERQIPPREEPVADRLLPRFEGNAAVAVFLLPALLLILRQCSRIVHVLCCGFSMLMYIFDAGDSRTATLAVGSMFLVVSTIAVGINLRSEGAWAVAAKLGTILLGFVWLILQYSWPAEDAYYVAALQRILLGGSVLLPTVVVVEGLAPALGAAGIGPTAGALLTIAHALVMSPAKGRSAAQSCVSCLSTASRVLLLCCVTFLPGFTAAFAVRHVFWDGNRYLEACATVALAVGMPFLVLSRQAQSGLLDGLSVPITRANLPGMFVDFLGPLGIVLCAFGFVQCVALPSLLPFTTLPQPYVSIAVYCSVAALLTGAPSLSTVLRPPLHASAALLIGCRRGRGPWYAGGEANSGSGDLVGGSSGVASAGAEYQERLLLQVAAALCFLSFGMCFSLPTWQLGVLAVSGLCCAKFLLTWNIRDAVGASILMLVPTLAGAMAFAAAGAGSWPAAAVGGTGGAQAAYPGDMQLRSVALLPTKSRYHAWELPSLVFLLAVLAAGAPLPVACAWTRVRRPTLAAIAFVAYDGALLLCECAMLSPPPSFVESLHGYGVSTDAATGFDNGVCESPVFTPPCILASAALTSLTATHLALQHAMHPIGAWLALCLAIPRVASLSCPRALPLQALPLVLLPLALTAPFVLLKPTGSSPGEGSGAGRYASSLDIVLRDLRQVPATPYAVLLCCSALCLAIVYLEARSTTASGVVHVATVFFLDASLLFALYRGTDKTARRLLLLFTTVSAAASVGFTAGPGDYQQPTFAIAAVCAVATPAAVSYRKPLLAQLLMVLGAASFGAGMVIPLRASRLTTILAASGLAGCAFAHALLVRKRSGQAVLLLLLASAIALAGAPLASTGTAPSFTEAIERRLGLAGAVSFTGVAASARGMPLAGNVAACFGSMALCVFFGVPAGNSRRFLGLGTLALSAICAAPTTFVAPRTYFWPVTATGSLLLLEAIFAAETTSQVLSAATVFLVMLRAAWKGDSSIGVTKRKTGLDLVLPPVPLLLAVFVHMDAVYAAAWLVLIVHATKWMSS